MHQSTLESLTTASTPRISLPQTSVTPFLRRAFSQQLEVQYSCPSIPHPRSCNSQKLAHIYPKTVFYIFSSARCRRTVVVPPWRCCRGSGCVGFGLTLGIARCTVCFQLWREPKSNPSTFGNLPTHPIHPLLLFFF